MPPIDLGSGWGRPGNATKFHYFTEDEPMRSICGNWGFYAGPREEGNDTSRDNCRHCFRSKVRRDERERQS